MRLLDTEGWGKPLCQTGAIYWCPGYFKGKAGRKFLLFCCETIG